MLTPARRNICGEEHGRLGYESAWSMRVMLPRESGLGARLTPFLSTLGCVFISVVPLHTPGFALATPGFALMAVFHWSIYRPELLPQSAVFALGLLLDLLSGTPYVGVSALMLLLVRTGVLMERRYFVGRTFAVLWLAFLVTAAAVGALTWAVVGLLRGELLGTPPFVFETALTVACYPVGSYLLVRLQRSLLRG